MNCSIRLTCSPRTNHQSPITNKKGGIQTSFFSYLLVLPPPLLPEEGILLPPERLPLGTLLVRDGVKVEELVLDGVLEVGLDVLLEVLRVVELLEVLRVVELLDVLRVVVALGTRCVVAVVELLVGLCG